MNSSDNKYNYHKPQGAIILIGVSGFGDIAELIEVN